MAVLILLYGHETWVSENKDFSKIQAAEIKFLVKVGECTRLDKIKREYIRKELSIYSVTAGIHSYKEKWLTNFNKMNDALPPL
jgi:hypothetical protein